MKSSRFMVLILFGIAGGIAGAEEFETRALDNEVGVEYSLDPSFYTQVTRAEGILIASSAKVSQYAHHEAAYQFSAVMRRINSGVANRIREAGVLCLLIGHAELTSELPHFQSQLKGEKLDFYNWRNRGFLTRKNDRPTVVFAEEDVLEYEGGMQIESILLHEFAHVIHHSGFDAGLQNRLADCFERATVNGLWRDGRAAQRFRRVDGTQPVSLLDELTEWFPQQSPAFLKLCLDGGDVLVNGKPTAGDMQVTGDDEVMIVFGGEKACYATRNKAEYWAEGVQCWYNTNRTMDHDHNHIHTREQLLEYDQPLARLCADVLGDSDWRFVSPRQRAGHQHLAGFDPEHSPVVVDAPHIRRAALDYYDDYWREFWPRLHQKYAGKYQEFSVPFSDQWLRYPGAAGPAAGKNVVLIAAEQEYRSEQSMPMLARLLAKEHGFNCTVLFGVNSRGEVDPTMKIRWEDKTVEHNIPGLEHLAEADLVIVFTRLLTLPDEQIGLLIDYLDSGRPVIGIRTANHGFLQNFPYELNGRKVNFGKDVLGGTFLSHHGNWHRDSTRGIIIEEQSDHPILQGVSDVWGPSDVYRTFPEGEQLSQECVALMLGQPLTGRSPDDGPNPNKIPLPIAWTKTWTGSAGKTARVFHVTMGSARDFQSEGLRRLVTNACYWCTHQESKIDPASSVEVLGYYAPLESGFNYEKLGVEPRKPEFYE